MKYNHLIDRLRQSHNLSLEEFTESIAMRNCRPTPLTWQARQRKSIMEKKFSSEDLSNSPTSAKTTAIIAAFVPAITMHSAIVSARNRFLPVPKTAMSSGSVPSSCKAAKILTTPMTRSASWCSSSNAIILIVPSPFPLAKKAMKAIGDTERPVPTGIYYVMKPPHRPITITFTPRL